MTQPYHHKFPCFFVFTIFHLGASLGVSRGKISDASLGVSRKTSGASLGVSRGRISGASRGVSRRKSRALRLAYRGEDFGFSA